ncbi:hypothetical protein [Thalassotalea castellviae]|uniref:Uncharacterized protein n=1 Tax=Thalassotalea castellviae TaxID=3075612 RepID=A0ABU3A5C5_9GAMM|nr:hypothetical protein [Thalassotalea sp. W431]MDT0605374.1 hypothetical protein [Thalassotalea sp. W431]
MKEFTGRKTITGEKVYDGDLVHCWDGTHDQREVTASLKGKVVKVEYSDETQFEVDGNNLALYCAEHVEILKDT